MKPESPIKFGNAVGQAAPRLALTIGGFALLFTHHGRQNP